MKDIRYDRQLRLWGDHGQSSVESTSVCVLGSSSLATEIIKNLVLAGVHRVCVIDDVMVQKPDLGQNFFLTKKDLGKSRAECVVVNLKELNPSVQCEARVVSQKDLNKEEHLRFLKTFSVVVASNTAVREGDFITDLADILYEHNIPFVYTRVCGLLGTIRISVKEHHIFDSHEENPKPDLRLDKPFSTLQKMIDEYPELTEMTTEQVKHTPYLILYFRALSVYRNMSNNATTFPLNHNDRKNFIDCLWKLGAHDEDKNFDSENFDEAKAAVLRSVLPTAVPSNVMDILKDPKCVDYQERNLFWLLCFGLKKFVEKYGVLPLSGSLPDMTSDSKSYTHLARIFHEKAQQDATEVLEFVKEEKDRRGMSNVISKEKCDQFCKKAAHIRLQRGTRLQYVQGLKPLFEEILMSYDDASPTPAVWLLLLHASLRFGLQKLRFPGECQNMPHNQDLNGLMDRVKWLAEDNGYNAEEILKKMPTNAFKEILRFANSEPHVISSFIGGVTAQEIIKLATKQYVPLETTFIYDGISQNSATFKL